MDEKDPAQDVPLAVKDCQKVLPMAKKAGVKDSTEKLITAVQERALNTRASKAFGVSLTREDLRCRLCKDVPKTIQQITAG